MSDPVEAAPDTSIHEGEEQTRIQDVDKAWDMAHSAKDERDSAAFGRKSAINREAKVTSKLEMVDKINALHEEADKLYGEIGYDVIRAKPESPEAQRIRELEAEQGAIKDQLTNPENPDYMPEYLVHDFAERPYISADDVKERIEKEAKEHASSDRAMARRDDKEAAAIEEWAGILHDHPVSEAYLDAHPNLVIDPKRLLSMERESEGELEDTRVLEEMVNKLPAIAGIDGAGDEYVQYAPDSSGSRGALNPFHVMEDAYGREETHYDDEARGFVPNEDNNPKWAEWRGMLASPDTTLGSLRDFYVEAFKKAHIDPRRARATEMKKIVDDIRSGRATHPPAPEAEAA